MRGNVPSPDLSFRKLVTSAEARKEMDGDINPFTKQQYSVQYKNILKERKRLPVYAQMDEFLKVFSENQIMVVMGETGSGKTTQIPQFVAYSYLPHASGKVVACTQTRQSPTLSIAQRVASEMDLQLGRHVGYSIRFNSQTEPGTTFLQYMTDEILLQEAMHDPLLEQYSTIILDEVHERGVATDILMALLKGIAKERKDLRIIIMSDILDLDAVKLQKYFSLRSNMTVRLFKIPSHIHSVEVFYTQKPCPDYLEAAIRTVIMIHGTEDPGDILLFLTGDEEIEETCRKIKLEADDLVQQDQDSIGPLVCIPLYSSLPLQEKRTILDPAPSPSTQGGPRGREVIVSSNIPETSMMDGIVYVVDPSFSVGRVYNPRIRVESFLISPISKVSAQQRARCAGRTKPGKCFRLYPENCFRTELEERSPPKILASNLSNLVLTLLKLGVRDLVSFDYVDTPAPETLMRALELLNYLEALDDDGNLTPLGGLMAEFPYQLDPQLTKSLIVSPEFKCSNEMLTIVAMTSAGNIWLRPHDQIQEANAARAKTRFTHPEGDHLTLLEVYNQYVLNRHDSNWAASNYLSGCALREADNIRTQLQKIMERLDIDLVTMSDQKKLAVKIRQALVCGFFTQVARKNKQKDNYCTIRDFQIVALHPSCTLDTKPEWVIFNEFILTTQSYIRTVSAVKAEWLMNFAPHYFNSSGIPPSQRQSPSTKKQRTLLEQIGRESARKR